HQTPTPHPATARPRAGGASACAMRRKADLPTRICACCGRPFAWRKKWAAVWDEVKYCSERCRRQRKAGPAPEGRP
ncbi:MAG: DUF2256 domain-containing protein, partial [Zoogloea sp.]|uniref:DUF2256 domain-containing protein n=1 Tax=Zoogloea sp. TaxID=49181 RepID=UPI003F3492A0